MWEAANAIFTTHIWGWLVYRTHIIHIYGDDLGIVYHWVYHSMGTLPRTMGTQATTVSSVTPGRMFGEKYGVC